MRSYRFGTAIATLCSVLLAWAAPAAAALSTQSFLPVEVDRWIGQQMEASGITRLRHDRCLVGRRAARAWTW
jgi:hypothetical protein